MKDVEKELNRKLNEARYLSTEGTPESQLGFSSAIKKILHLHSTGWQLADFIEEFRQFEKQYDWLVGDDYYEASLYARRLNIKYMEDEENVK